MNTVYLATVLSWSVLVLALGAATVLSVLAWLKPRPLTLWFATGALAIAVVAAASVSESVPPGLGALVGGLGLAVAVFGGGPAATTALHLAMGGDVTPGLHGGILVAVRPVPGDTQAVSPGARREVLRGGLTIGVLERVATAGSIIAGFPEGLAIVVAIKGVGRFTELDAAEARERFIIGTFASLIWACAAGLAVHLAIR